MRRIGAELADAYRAVGMILAALFVLAAIGTP